MMPHSGHHKSMKIDFVSDVSCPWCAIGLRSLETALERIGPDVQAELHFQPFELNPTMGREGQDVAEYLGQKYGLSPEQFAQSNEAIRARGAALGFTFQMEVRRRIHNTFDAHRLLHWAGLEGRQHELKRALFKAYFTDGQDPSDHAVLVRLAQEVGLDVNSAPVRCWRPVPMPRTCGGRSTSTSNRAFMRCRP